MTHSNESMFRRHPLSALMELMNISFFYYECLCALKKQFHVEMWKNVCNPWIIYMRAFLHLCMPQVASCLFHVLYIFFLFYYCCYLFQPPAGRSNRGFHNMTCAVLLWAHRGEWTQEKKYLQALKRECFIAFFACINPVTFILVKC